MTENVVFYHSADNDGRCSGAIARIALESKGGVEIFGMDYGDDPDEIADLDGVKVWFIDVTPDVEWLRTRGEAIFKKCGAVAVIDHHVSFAEKVCKKLDGPEFELKGEFFWLEFHYDDALAACELAWSVLMKTQPPWNVRLLGVYDTWARDSTMWQAALEFQYGMRAHDTEAGNDWLWDRVFRGGEHFERETRKAGRAIIGYKSQCAATDTANRVEEFVLHPGACGDAEPLKVVAFHGLKSTANSSTFEHVFDENRHQAMLHVHADPSGKAVFSLYSPAQCAEVKDLAVSYGGGGHAHAAGFTVAGVDKYPLWRALNTSPVEEK